VAGLRTKANIGPAVSLVAVVFITVFAIVNIRDANTRAADGLRDQFNRFVESQACRDGLAAAVAQATADVQTRQADWFKALSVGAGVNEAEFEWSVAERVKQDALLAQSSADRLCG
jgi:hypothetical protein